MRVKCKEIMVKNQKKCEICHRDVLKDDIIIMGKHICKDCVNQLSNITVEDENYNLFKDKIKSFWSKFKFK